MSRPFCGVQSGTPVPTTSGGFLALIGLVMTLVGVITSVKAAGSGAIGFSLLGIAAIPLAAVAGAALVFAFTVYAWLDRCRSKDGPQRCWAGVVNAIVPSFDSNWDVVFPSGAQHPRVDVVVKSAYWELTTAGASTVKCSEAPASSPLIQTFYKSQKVCTAGVGAMLGAFTALAVVTAIAAGIAIAGCVTIILCLFALLIALAIGVAAALVGAAAGGLIGSAISGDDAPQASGSSIAVGDLITVKLGTLLTMEAHELANVGWWAGETALHGEVAAAPPYSDLHAEELEMDACPVREPPPIG